MIIYRLCNHIANGKEARYDTYHGSTIDISQIELSKSKPNKDFGRAFYLSEDREQAM